MVIFCLICCWFCISFEFWFVCLVFLVFWMVNMLCCWNVILCWWCFEVLFVDFDEFLFVFEIEKGGLVFGLILGRGIVKFIKFIFWRWLNLFKYVILSSFFFYWRYFVIFLVVFGRVWMLIFEVWILLWIGFK